MLGCNGGVLSLLFGWLLLFFYSLIWPSCPLPSQVSHNSFPLALVTLLISHIPTPSNLLSPPCSLSLFPPPYSLLPIPPSPPLGVSGSQYSVMFLSILFSHRSLSDSLILFTLLMIVVLSLLLSLHPSL